MATMQRIKLKGANVETSRSVRRLLQYAMQEMVVAWIIEWLSVGNGEKWSDLRYLLKVDYCRVELKHSYHLVMVLPW